MTRAICITTILAFIATTVPFWQVASWELVRRLAQAYYLSVMWFVCIMWDWTMDVVIRICVPCRTMLFESSSLETVFL